MKITNQVQALLFIFGICISGAAISDCHEPHKIAQGLFTGADTEAAQVVNAFHKALETGDNVAATRLLAKNVLILEGKRAERSADEYAGSHMPLDMAYFKNIDVKILEHHVQQFDSFAISIFRRSNKGLYKGEIIDRVVNGTFTLSKESDGWKITHIHWSY